MSGRPTKVFLDANVVIQAGKPPGGLILSRLKKLIDAGFITVLTTDLTCQEVAKKHADNDYKVIKEVGQSHFRKIVGKVLGAKLPNITRSELRAKLTEIYEQSTTAMFKDLRCKTLVIDNIKPSIVFSAYATNEGFFADEGKKNQFPDAFIFECLKAEASRKEPVIIVSKDGDFTKPVESEDYISLVKSLPELFEKLGLKVDVPGIENFLECHKKQLVEAVDSELEDWGLIGDVEDSEIEETNVTEVEAMDIMSFGSTNKGGPILVAGRLSVKVNISYIHPDWDHSIYDSEDKRYIAFEDVSGETEVSFDVDVSMSVAVDENGNPERIEELSFRNDDFQYVELHPYYGYS